MSNWLSQLTLYELWFVVPMGLLYLTDDLKLYFSCLYALEYKSVVLGRRSFGDCLAVSEYLESNWPGEVRRGLGETIIDLVRRCPSLEGVLPRFLRLFCLKNPLTFFRRGNGFEILQGIGRFNGFSRFGRSNKSKGVVSMNFRCLYPNLYRNQPYSGLYYKKFSILSYESLVSILKYNNIYFHFVNLHSS